jgi:MFS family permease
MASSPTTHVGDVLRTPGAARMLVSSLVARLPFTAVALLLLLLVRDLGGSYAEGGLVAGAFSLAMGLAAPGVGRLVDTHGQTPVLAFTGLAGAASLLVLALLPDGTPVPAVAALAALAGVTHPPIGSCMRALWPVLLGDEDRRHAAYAIEASGIEVMFVLGPLVVVGGVAALAGPGAGLAVCAAFLLVGTAAFASGAASRRWRPDRARTRSPLGALGSVGLLTLLAVVACMGASFAAIELATTAFAEEEGRRALVGPLLAAWALGSMVGGVLTARRGAPVDPPRHITVMLGATAATDALLALAPGAAALAALLLLAGCCIAPAFATLYGVVGRVARAGTLTESYTWLLSGIGGGAALGAALAGGVVSASSPRAGFVVAALMVAVAAVVAGLGRSRITAPPPRPVAA